jgi:hypothetical protein
MSRILIADLIVFEDIANDTPRVAVALTHGRRNASDVKPARFTLMSSQRP